MTEELNRGCLDEREAFGYIADFEWGSSDGNSRIYRTPKPGQGMVVPVYLAPQTPIDMVLHCPACGLQHVDAPDERTPDWKNEPHRSHLCHGCGHIWRPADVPTNGVLAVKTKGKADSPLASLSTSKQAGAEPVAAYLMTRPSGFAWTLMPKDVTPEWRAVCEAEGTTIQALIIAAPSAAIAAREQEGSWPKLDKPAQVDCSFGVGVSTRLVVEAAQRRYERESANREKTLADALNDPRPMHEQIAEIRQQQRPTAEVLNMVVGATHPAAIPAAPSDAEIIALNEGECFFSESPSKYPEYGFGTQYHTGKPGLLQFARAVLALTQPTTVQQASSEEIVANWVAEQWHAEVANRPLVNVHRKRLDDKWRQLLERLHVDHRARLGPTHDELTAQTTALPGGNREGE